MPEHQVLRQVLSGLKIHLSLAIHFKAISTPISPLVDAVTSEKTSFVRDLLESLNADITPLLEEQRHLESMIKKLEQSKMTQFFNAVVYNDNCAVKTRLNGFLLEYRRIFDEYKSNNDLADLRRKLTDLFQCPENAVFKKYSGVWGAFLNFLDSIAQNVFASKRFQTETQTMLETLVDASSDLTSPKASAAALAKD